MSDPRTSKNREAAAVLLARWPDSKPMPFGCIGAQVEIAGLCVRLTKPRRPGEWIARLAYSRSWQHLVCHDPESGDALARALTRIQGGGA